MRRAVHESPWPSAHVSPAHRPPAGGTITRAPGAPSTPQGRPAHDRAHPAEGHQRRLLFRRDLEDEL